MLGSPIGHSLSPVLHRAAYAALGVTDADYARHEVGAGELAAFLAGPVGSALDGVSVTMPGKREAWELAADRDPTAARLGIANTLVRRPDGSWRAENHDVHGIWAALQDHGVGRIARGGVLGSGATALSAAAALLDLGAREVRLTARSPERLEPVARVVRDAGADAVLVPWERAEGVLAAEAVVSALAVPGARALAEDWSDGRVLPRPDAFLDVLYDPWPAPLAALLETAGVPVASGLEMLVHQADLQVRSMLGVPSAPVATMLAAARTALAERA